MLPYDFDPTLRTFARTKDDLDSRESSVEGRAKRYAKSLGYWVRKFKAPGASAVPDDIFKHANGPGFFIEFKARGKTASPAQLQEHDLMRQVGLIVYVVDNFDDAKKIIDANCL